MRKHWHVFFFTLSVLLLCYACGNKDGKTQPSLSDSDSLEIVSSSLETDSTTYEDDGDPNIKAASADRMKMVVDNRGTLVGRYVQTNQTTFTVSAQDDIEVPRLGHKIVEYSARNGQGIVYTLRKNVNVRQFPDLKSPVICQITTKDGETPKTYPCLGKTKGWYKIRVRGTEGYVRHDLVIWDGMSAF